MNGQIECISRVSPRKTQPDRNGKLNKYKDLADFTPQNTPRLRSYFATQHVAAIAEQRIAAMRIAVKRRSPHQQSVYHLTQQRHGLANIVDPFRQPIPAFPTGFEGTAFKTTDFNLISL
ncbi:MAG: hypothetical protein ACI9G1_001259 [Pirellulaceae bacterium]